MTTDSPKDLHHETPLDEEAFAALTELQTGLIDWREQGCPQKVFHVNLHWVCREVWHRLHDVGRPDLAGLIHKYWDAIERLLAQIDPKGVRTDPSRLQEPLQRLEDAVTLCDQSLSNVAPAVPQKPARCTGRAINYREAAEILAFRNQDGEIAPDALRKRIDRAKEGSELWALRRGGPARIGGKLQEGAVRSLAGQWNAAAELQRLAYARAMAQATLQKEQAETAVDPADTAKHVERVLDRSDMRPLSALAREPK